MAEFDLVIRGGTVVTAADTFRADVGVRDGRIAALGEKLDGAQVLDAGGLLVLPGGVDTHCHIEQLRPTGGADEESFVTGSTACLAGGTTTVITFAAQFKGHGIRDTLAEYHRRAKLAMVDYSFHQIITDPSDAVVRDEIPEVVASGVRSLKVFLTYEPSHLDDREFLRVLAAARRTGALVTVHCENYEAIRWRTAALMAAGRSAPKYHAWSRPKIVEREATHRAIALAELVDQPIQVFHVSCSEVAEEIARAQARGLKVWAETCPQYFVLGADDMDRPGFEGAKFMCSPSPRDAATSEALWGDIQRGTLDVVSSDHSGAELRGRGGQTHPRQQRAVPGYSERRSGPGRAAADRVQRGRGGRKDRPQPLCAPGRDQSGEAVRAVSAQGDHRARFGRRFGAVGLRKTRHHHQRDDAAYDRLHSLRRDGGHRLAGCDGEGRPRGDARREGAGGAGDWPIPGAGAV